MSLLQQLIARSVFLSKKTQDSTDTATKDSLTIQYGYPFATHRQRSRWNCRAILLCGCNKGRVPVKVDGVRTNETKPHVDCQGLGFRLNKRFGRPV